MLGSCLDPTAAEISLQPVRRSCGQSGRGVPPTTDPEVRTRIAAQVHGLP